MHEQGLGLVKRLSMRITARRTKAATGQGGAGHKEGAEQNGGAGARGLPMICLNKIGVAWHVADWVIFMDAGAVVEISGPKASFTSPKHSRTKLFAGQIL
jgi:hypothetical protein